MALSNKIYIHHTGELSTDTAVTHYVAVSTEYLEKDRGRLPKENYLELTDFKTGAGISSKTRQRENATTFLKLVSKAAHNLLLNQRSSNEKVGEQMWERGKQCHP